MAVQAWQVGSGGVCNGYRDRLGYSYCRAPSWRRCRGGLMATVLAAAAAFALVLDQVKMPIVSRFDVE